MKPIPDWDNIKPAHPGDLPESPPPGPYICRIVNVDETTSKAGQPMIKLDIDIDEGVFKDFFYNDFKSLKARGWEPRWSLSIFQLFNGNSAPFFKGLIDDIQKSNPNFKFDFNTSKLVGKRLVVMLDSDEYNYNGSVRTRLKAGRTFTVKQFENGECGEPFVIGTDGKRRKLSSQPPPPPEPMPEDYDVSELDIPF